MIGWLWAIAWSAATPSFDPTTAAQVFTGPETFTLDGSRQIWSAIERHHDADPTLFGQASFNEALAWPADSAFAPAIADCFGTATPDSGAFLLHQGLGAATATGTPILLVPGAGDNGSRGFSIVSRNLDATGRPVYAVTFAHPHDDVFVQAEVVANAVARVRALTGAAQVDLVSHSKGGLAAAVYLSHQVGSDWGSEGKAPAYAAVGTPFQGDVRRAVFIATPLDGIDTAYRWPSGNYAGLDAATALSPTSWSSYNSFGWAFPLLATDLADQDMAPDGADLFPGQRQLLKRHDDSFPLPGGLPWLGPYAVQQDWFTTYEGGFGFVSASDGIDAAIGSGGAFIDTLAAQGVDPAVELFVLAGDNPLMPNGTEAFLEGQLGPDLVDWVTMGTDAWAALVAAAAGNSFAGLGVGAAELQGLVQGKLLLGEISGPSDGLVFVQSATHTAALTARGAVVQEVKVVSLSHLDLLNAAADVWPLLSAAALADPIEDGWQADLAVRYEAADTVGWLAAVLADPPAEPPVDEGDTGGGPPAVDTSAASTDPSTPGAEAPSDPATGPSSPSGARGCASAGSPAGVWWGLLLAGASRIRRRRT